MPIYTYDPSRVVVAISGYQLTGIESITVKPTTKQFKFVRGIRGVNTRARSKDTSAVVTLQIMQTSISNDVLSSLVTQDLKLGTGRCLLVIKDFSGQSVIASLNAYVTGWAEYKAGQEIDSRTWEIMLLDTTEFNVGSNFLSSPNLF